MANKKFFTSESLASLINHIKSLLDTKADTSHTHTTLETKIDATAKLNEAKAYADSIAENKSNLNHGHTVASTSNDGFMSADMVTRLEQVEANSGKITIDDALSDTSVNPVQNKVINAEFDAISEALRVYEAVLDEKAEADDLTSHTNNKSNPHGVTAAQVGAYTKSEIDSTVSTLNTAISGKANSDHTHDDRYYTESEIDSKISTLNSAIDKKMGDFTIQIYNGTGGNPKPVRFASFNYSTCDSENGIAAKISMVSGHGNGSSYAFLQDAIIKVSFNGSVSVDNFKYYGTDCGTYDDEARHYGDIFWLIDETNKIVDFYVLMGQYARVQQTPWKRLTYSSKGVVTQHTSCAVYSSGTKNWANNDEIATKGDIPEGQDLSKYAVKATTLSGYGITDAYTKDEVDVTVAGLNASIDSKAAKATTLSGYGITDAYTKTQVDNALAGKQAAGSYAASNHTHDDRYYTESEIDTKLAGKANSSHGNHVPTTQTANNAVFLRNDNTWATVTPSNIGAYTKSEVDSALSGKAASSHTHDDRYYTETEINTKVSTLQSSIDGKVPTSRTVNGKALSSNISLSASDVGADASGSASSALTNAKSYTDGEIAKLINASDDGVLNSITELADAIEENDSAIEVLNAVAAGKAKSNHTHTVSYTPAGTVSKPSFTGTEASTTSISGVDTVYSITDVGTLPSHSYTAPSHSYTAPSLSASCANKCLTFTFSAGSHSFSAGSHTFSAGTLPTKGSGTAVATGTHTHKYTPAGSVSQPTFSGTAATLTSSTEN